LYFQFIQGDFYEAVCKDIDPVKKELVCCFPADSGLDEACFKVSYDLLLVGVSDLQQTLQTAFLALQEDDGKRRMKNGSRYAWLCLYKCIYASVSVSCTHGVRSYVTCQIVHLYGCASRQYVQTMYRPLCTIMNSKIQNRHVKLIRSLFAPKGWFFLLKSFHCPHYMINDARPQCSETKSNMRSKNKHGVFAQH